MATLRTQLAGGAITLGVVTLSLAAALVGITNRMENDAERLYQSVSSVRATDELEVALLLHARERRLLQQGVGSVEALETAEERARRWLRASRDYVSTHEEARMLEDLVRELEAYLTRARGPGGYGSPELETVFLQLIQTSERVVSLKAAEAEDRLAGTRQLSRRANVIGLGVILVLLGGVGVVLWAERRLVYRPILTIQRALAQFRLGGRWAPVPERGPTELRDLAASVNRMADRIQQQREHQLGFLAAVAHDLRNPLQALRLAVGARREGQEIPADRAQQRLLLVRTQVDRLARLINDLLDTTRIEAGRLVLSFAEHDVRELVRESVELHRPMSELHRLQLEAPEGPALVRADATRLTQVFNNLLSNAIKYSPEGGMVTVRLTAYDGGWAVSVSDPGVGIPAADLEGIFEPFHRSSNTRDTIPGVGLGLAVSRRIVEAHGGRMEVESTPGRGSTFRVFLPREGPRAG